MKTLGKQKERKLQQTRYNYIFSESKCPYVYSSAIYFTGSFYDLTFQHYVVLILCCFCWWVLTHIQIPQTTACFSAIASTVCVFLLVSSFWSSTYYSKMNVSVFEPPCLMFKETATRKKKYFRWMEGKKKQSSLSSQQFYNQCRYYGNLARAIWRDTARLVCSFNVLKAATIIVLSLFSFSAPWGFLSLQFSFFFW